MPSTQVRTKFNALIVNQTNRELIDFSFPKAAINPKSYTKSCVDGVENERSQHDLSTEYITLARRVITSRASNLRTAIVNPRHHL